MKNRLPKFKNEDEEREFWVSRDSTDYLDWSKAKTVVLPNLKPSLKSAAEHGRDPEEIKILPGIVPVIGATEAEAQRKEAELTERIVHGYALQTLSSTLGVQLDEQDLDRTLRADELPGEDQIETAKSRYTLVVDLARRENLTVREIIHRLGGGRGHRTFTGTPEQVADTIEHWFTAGAADGFNVMPAVLPSGLEDFVDHVVPILRARGLFRSEYSGSTLREHYGLPHPVSQFAGRDSAVLSG